MENILFQAQNLLNKLISYEFTLLLSFMTQVTRATHCITTQLQKKSLDVLSTCEMMINTNRMLQAMRNDENALKAVIKVNTHLSFDIYLYNFSPLSRDKIELLCKTRG
jgi:hypothetical protein